jgi:hypothetical protein
LDKPWQQRVIEDGESRLTIRRVEQLRSSTAPAAPNRSRNVTAQLAIAATADPARVWKPRCVSQIRTPVWLSVLQDSAWWSWIPVRKPSPGPRRKAFRSPLTMVIGAPRLTINTACRPGNSRRVVKLAVRSQ